MQRVSSHCGMSSVKLRAASSYGCTLVGRSDTKGVCERKFSAVIALEDYVLAWQYYLGHKLF